MLQQKMSYRAALSAEDHGTCTSLPLESRTFLAAQFHPLRETIRSCNYLARSRGDRDLHCPKPLIPFVTENGSGSKNQVFWHATRSFLGPVGNPSVRPATLDFPPKPQLITSRSTQSGKLYSPLFHQGPPVLSLLAPSGDSYPNAESPNEAEPQTQGAMVYNCPNILPMPRSLCQLP